MEHIQILNYFVFNAISCGLLKVDQQIESLFLSSVPEEERKDFSRLHAVRVIYASICCTDIEPFKPLYRPARPTPVVFLQKAIQAVLDFDTDQIRKCDLELENILPNMPKQKRWSIVLKYLYLSIACEIELHDHGGCEQLMFTATSGFWTRLRNHILYDCQGRRRTKNERTNYIWRAANRKSFTYGLRPTIKNLVYLKIAGRNHPLFDEFAFDFIFTAPITGPNGRRIDPLCLAKNPRLKEKIRILGEKNYYLENGRVIDTAPKAPIAPICHIERTKKRQPKLSISDNVCKHIYIGFCREVHLLKNWITSVFGLTLKAAKIVAIHILSKIGFYDIQYLNTFKGDKDIAPKYTLKRGDPGVIDCLIIKPAYISENHKNWQMNFTDTSIIANHESSHLINKLKEILHGEEIAYRLNKSTNKTFDIEHSAFMHQSGKKFIDNFKPLIFPLPEAS